MDYTTLASVKQYLGIGPPAGPAATIDNLINALIPRECRLIDRYCGRTFGKIGSFTKNLNGTGTSRLPLPESPILSVTSLTVCQQTLAYEPTQKNVGFTYDDSLVYLNLGQRFPQGHANVPVSWTTGYVGSDQGSVPPSYQVQPGDVGRAVSIVSATINGVAAAVVTTAPAQGQINLDAPTGTVTFNAADAMAPYTLSYLAIPAPIEQAANEMVGLDLKQRDNLGISSKSLAGETISYSDSAMTKSTIALLNAYRRWWIG